MLIREMPDRQLKFFIVYIITERIILNRLINVKVNWKPKIFSAMLLGKLKIKHNNMYSENMTYR